MPRIIRCALFLSSLLFLSSTAWAEMNDKQALERVKNQPSKEGVSLDAYFEEQKSQAKMDLGWKIYPRHNGSYEVERLMLLNEKSPTSFKWVVDRDGNIKPINGKAMGVTK